MATSTILEPIRVNDEHGATVLVEALEAAEHTPYRKPSEDTVLRTTDPETIRRVTAKVVARVNAE